MGSKANRKQVATADGCGRDVKEAAAWAAFYKDVALEKYAAAPKGWKTSAQIAVILGMSKNGLSNTMKVKEREGKLKGKVRMYKIKIGSFVRNVKHYYCEEAASQKD